MRDFRKKEEEFFRKVAVLEAEFNLSNLDIRLRQLPEPGIKLPGDVDSDVARQIVRIYNEVFR